ncbi:MAG: OsmC family protein [Chitinophagaceae bacterium]
MKTTTTWKREHSFESQSEGNVFQVDGNKKEGPNPKSLLLTAVATCSGIDVVDILTKMKVDFSGLDIDAEAEQTEEHPRVFKDILVTYRIRTDEVNRPKVVKAIELSLEKYCGVSAMLRKNSGINYTLELSN